MNDNNGEGELTVRMHESYTDQADVFLNVLMSHLVVYCVQSLEYIVSISMRNASLISEQAI